MAVYAPFQPSYSKGQVLAPAAASASVPIGLGSKQLALTNLGANVCYVRTSSGASTATTADYAIPSGAHVVISKDQDHDTLAHISAAGTSLHVIPGDGW